MQNANPFLTECIIISKPIMLKRSLWLNLKNYFKQAGSKMFNEYKNIILLDLDVSVPHTHRSTSRFLLDLQLIPADEEKSTNKI